MQFVVVLCQAARSPHAHPRRRMSGIGPRTQHLQRSWRRAAYVLFDESANLLVSSGAANDPVSLQDSARVRIHYEHWMIAGIEQNGIRSLRPNSVEGQQLRPQLFGGRGKHAL